MARTSLTPRKGPGTQAQCKICGVGHEQVNGQLIDCKLEHCQGKACLSCCSLMGGPFAEACKTCDWGKQFWKEGHPAAPPLDADDAMLLYA